MAAFIAVSRLADAVMPLWVVSGEWEAVLIGKAMNDVMTKFRIDCIHQRVCFASAAIQESNVAGRNCSRRRFRPRARHRCG